MQHAIGSIILNVDIRARRLVGNVEARHVAAGVASRLARLVRRRARRVDLEGFVGDEIPIGCRLAVGRLHRSIDDGQRGWLGAELFRRQSEQYLARFRRHLPHGRAAIRHGERAGGDALVGHQTRVAGGDGDASEIDVELIGAELRDRGQHALTELDLADEQADLAIRLHAQP